MNFWRSKYTLESKKASNGKSKEVFRGIKELKRKVVDIESIVVHEIPPQGAFDIISRSNRFFYVWKSKLDVVIKAISERLIEDQKAAIGAIYSTVTIGNGSTGTGLVVEVSSIPYEKQVYKTIGEKKIKHMPVIYSSKDITDYLDGELNQVNVHDLAPYDFLGNHTHADGRKELFVVVQGEAHVFERKSDAPAENFGDILKKISGDEIMYENYDKGGAFSIDSLDEEKQRVSHAIVAGKKRTRLIEISSIAFSPEVGSLTTTSDSVVPEDYELRKRLLEKLI